VGRPLAAMLRLNKVLTHLDLSNNFIDEDAGVAIAQALTVNRKVRPQPHIASQ
jgi:Ran GTPase-activating protein (RanGAP) involved in mRNA processing and transport